MRFVLLMLGLLAGLPASAEPGAAKGGLLPVPAAPQGSGATVLSFMESEPGIEPYRSRIMVTPQYLRLDNGKDDDDFVLLKRAERTIYSTNREDGTVLVIPRNYRQVESPLPLRLSSTRQPMPDAPTIAGRRAEHFQHRVNEAPCYDMVAVPGLLPDALAAMLEYREILASEHRRVLALTPADTHESCDLALNVFHVRDILGQGLPVQEWSPGGYRRSLVGLEEKVRLDPRLFELPKDYRHYRLDTGS